MLDMIQNICMVITGIAGLIYLLLPADKLIKEENLKNGETMEEATKKIRKTGIFYLLLTVFLWIF